MTKYLVIHEEGTYQNGRYTPGTFRVLNTKTGSLNKATFTTRKDAKAKVKQLENWDKYNKAPAGLARTAKANAKYLAKYHAAKATEVNNGG